MIDEAKLDTLVSKNWFESLKQEVVELVPLVFPESPGEVMRVSLEAPSRKARRYGRDFPWELAWAHQA